jgi:hypothetical protein
MHPTETTYFYRLVERNNSELQYMLDHPEGIVKEAYKVVEYILEERNQAVKYLKLSDEGLIEALKDIDKEEFPVRYKFLENEIRNRDFNRNVDNFNEEAPKVATISRKMKLSPLLKFRKRPDIVLKLQGRTELQLDDISDEGFRSHLMEPESQEVLVVEDSRTRLFIQFDTSKHEYGYKFWYFDKYQKSSFHSILHGISDVFAFQLISGFIENGKTELELLNWKEIKESDLQKFLRGIVLIINYSFIATVVFFLIDNSYLETGITDYVQSFLETNPIYFIGFIVFSIIFTVIRDRHQLLNLRKLSPEEIIDTLVPIFFLPLFLIVIYIFWTSGGFN